MGKKKKNRQQEPGVNGEESTESGDETQSSSIGSVVCPHIAKAVDLQKVKKSLKPSGNLPRECVECTKSKEPLVEEDDDADWTPNLWLCLKCGNVACGRMRRQHALKHYSTPHSEPHDLALNTDDWRVWCYSCDDQIPVAQKRKLLECVEFVKRQTSILLLPLNCNANVVETPSAVQNEDVTVVDSNRSVTFMGRESSSKAKSTVPIPNNLPRVRGLSNLGNTCFFNAVLQCLAQTPYLLPILQEMSEPGQRFHLSGNPEQNLPPMSGELMRWGALTEALADTLEELQSNRAEVFTPRKLLSKLTVRWPQFGGGDQHDSHELLRHMLEGVRSEDVKRYQRHILHQLGLSEKVDPSQVEDDLRVKAKAYAAQVNELLLHPEHVFRGYLVSIVQCQDCQHSSHRVESFLDLSLPVIADKPQPPVWRRKNSQRDDMFESSSNNQQPSKYQLKKERKQARRVRKSTSKTSTSPDKAYETTVAEENGVGTKSGDSEPSDADVEDNIDQETRVSKPHDVGESGYSSEKLANEDSAIDSPLLNGDSMLASPVSPRALSVETPGGAAALAPASPSSASSEMNVECAGGPISPGDSSDRPVSRLEFHHATDLLASDFSRLSLEGNTCRSEGNTCRSLVPVPPPPPQSGGIIALDWHNGHAPDEEDDEEEDDDDEDLSKSSGSCSSGGGASDSSWSHTLAQRYQCEEGDTSVQSCLSQFTAVELMTGNNKVGCENCTQRVNHGKEGKMVYTNATKQLLVSAPPAVLILHLKRFQVLRAMFRKISCHVRFPMVLDLAPICSVKCKESPTMNPEQTQVLYALFGIVEHSGTLHGGHYVAYVKVRPNLAENDPRWAFVPPDTNRPQHAAPRKVDEAAGVTTEPPPGKWYYVSDSRVSEVTEDQVLQSQAYLLFYERIW